MRLAVTLVFVTACVSSGTYNHKVAELTKLRADDAAAAKTRDRDLSDQIATAKKRSAELQARLDETQRALDKANAERAALQKSVDDDTQLVATLKQRLEKLGQ